MSGSGLDLLLAAGALAAVIWLLRSRPAGPGAAWLVGAQNTLPVRGGSDGTSIASGWKRATTAISGYFPKAARQAGFDPGSLFGLFVVSRVVLALLLPSLAIEILMPWGRLSGMGGSRSAVVLAVPAILGFVLPDLWLLGVRRRRRAKVAQALSFFVDLMVAFLHSGLSLERAFRRAGREGLAPSHPLAREVAILGQELDAGQDPTTAFRALAARTGVADLRALAAALELGARLGTPVRSTLTSQAELLWTKRRETALKRINAASVKVTFPVMLAGFPLFFLLTFFPAILQLLEEVRAVLG